jgi:Na+/melibiose symporter-like transporter
MTATTFPSPRPRLSHFRLALMSLYWFATNVHWGAILIITLPAQANIIGGGDAKGGTLGSVLLAGAFVSMVIAPLAGAISDRWVTPYGRRRPWIVVGTLMNIPGLFGLAYFAQPGGIVSLPLYVAAFMWVEFWNNIATAPFSALIPDVVSTEQRGSASGWYGLMTLLGNFVGVLTGIIFTTAGVTNISAIYYFTAAIMLLGMLATVVSVREPAVDTSMLPPFRLGEFARNVLTPFKNRDFTWVFWTRFLMEMGAFTVQEFLLFYMLDVVKDFHMFGALAAQNAESAVSFFSIALLLGAVLSTLVAGILSDRVGRKPVVYIASALQAVVPVLLAFFYNFELAVLTGIVFGLGYGAYQSVDWALASDVLPSEEDHAKDMGVWHVAMTLPQVMAAPIAGLMLDRFQIIGQTSGLPTLGYQVIFLLAAAYFVLGTVLVRQIKKVK